MSADGQRRGRSDRPRGSNPSSGGRGARGSGNPSSSGRGSSRGGRSRPGDDRRHGDGKGRSERPPRTEAERRAAEVKARRGPRRTPRTPEGEQAKIDARETEQWIDEGSVRDEAVAATERAAGSSGRRSRTTRGDIDPEVAAEIRDAVTPDRARRLTERLASASAALDRERFDEARRMVAPLVRELPDVAAVHEVNGLAAYRLGRWTQAAQSLELARRLRPDPALLPVLADAYRGQRRWRDVAGVWDEIKAASPSHEIMAEGRMVAAGALADQGEITNAIALMESAAPPPKRVRDHHLRQWYVLGDLYDRAGDPMSATRWFREVASREPDFADVRDRIRSLGR